MYYIYAKTFLLMQRIKTMLPKSKWARFGASAVILLVIIFGFSFVSATSMSEDIANGFLNIFARMFLWVATLFLKLSVFVLSFIIEIGGYNGFIESSAVNIGWVIVRDISNMFFVVALLVIAFGTILGLENYEWKKMLGKLFLAALLVNFSKTICGLIIDASQIVMITFINGVAATAGGNLINAFKLDGILKLSSDYTGSQAKQIADDGNVFMAAVAGLVFSSLVIAILLVYLFILLARMIVLWVLIVLSPLAFALTALPQTKSKYFDEWWKEFSNHVIIGPMLAFFLWLSFAVVGAGDVHQHVADKSDSPAKLDASETSKIGSNVGITKAMGWESMANFFIAIAMLWIGAEKAQALGAKGAGALAGARNFGAGVAKFASGVGPAAWAGKKLKDGAVNKVKGAAKERWDLAARKSGLTRLPLGKDSAGAIKMRAAKSRQDAYFADREKKIGAESNTGLYDVNKDKAAKMAVGAAVAEQKRASEKSERESKVEHDQAKKERATFTVRMNQSLAGRKPEDVPPADLYKMQDEAAKGLSLVESKIAGDRSTLAKTESDEFVKELTSSIGLAQLQSEYKEYDRRTKAAVGNLATQMVDPTADTDGKYSTLRGNITSENSAELSAIASPKDRMKRMKELAIQKYMTDEMKGKAFKAYNEGGKGSDKWNNGVATGLRHYSAFKGTESANKVSKKLVNWGEEVQAYVADELRMAEGKLPDKVLGRHMSKINEGMEEYNNMTDSELLGEIGENHKIIQEIEAVPEASRNAQQNQSMKNRRVRQVRAISSASGQGMDGLLGSVLAGLDKSYLGVDMNSPKERDRIIMGLVSGQKHDDINAGTQEQVRASMKEKGDIVFRTLMAGQEKAAKAGSAQAGYQVSVGRDSRGNKKVGLSNLMQKGLGSGDGAGLVIGTGTTGDGNAERKGYIQGNILPNFGISTSDSGRDYVATMMRKTTAGDIVEVPIGVQNPESEAAIMSIASLNANDVYKMSKSKIQFMTGGNFSQSSYDSSAKSIKAGNMTGVVKKLRKSFVDKLKHAKLSGSQNEKEKILQTWRAFYAQAGVKEVNGVPISSATFSDLKSVKVKNQDHISNLI